MRNMVSNIEIDAQKRVIYRYKSPFNFIFEPEFSTGSPVGERSPNLYEPLCGAINYIIENPTWRPTYVLVQSNIINRPGDFTY